MTISIAQILTKYGQNVVADIRANLASTGTNASGKTSNSINYEITEEGTKITLDVYGKPFIWVVETGRGPRKTTQSYGVVQNIRQWMDQKGVGSQLSDAKKDSLAKFFTWRINKEGSALFKKGGRKDIISNVITDTLIGKISVEVINNFVKSFMDEIEISFKK